MRKVLMRQYWRLQQSQTFISMGFWCTTLTLLIWPYVSWRFSTSCDAGICFSRDFIGISSTYWGLISIAVGVLSCVLLLGVVYDRFLGLWKEQRTVDTERNPFGTYALIPANVILIGQMNQLLRKSAAEDEATLKTCDWVDEWLAWCSSQEIWARAQSHWDETLPTKVPDLVFLPEGTVDEARDRATDMVD